MFETGSITPWWTTEHQDLEFKKVFFINRADVIKWRRQGYTQKHFLDSTHIVRNTSPEWVHKFFNLVQGENPGVTFLKMATCDITPYHSDTYKFYKKIHKLKDSTNIRRVIIFLEDWKPGHIFEIENTPITQWKAGDFVTWKNDVLHMAANLGTETRYTAQITITDVQDYIRL